MKVLVGFPPTLSAKGTPLLSQNRQFQYFDVPTFLFPVAMGTAATMARDKYKHDVIWYDAISENMDWDAFDAMIEREQPKVFFFETKAPVVKKHWEAVHHLKQKFPKLKLVICGDHVTYAPRETMEMCPIDYVINGGYYDFAFCELLDYLDGKREDIPQGIWYRKKGKIVDNGKYDFKGSLDDAPIIDRVLTKNKNYQKEFNLKGRPLAYIMSGRDCWYGKCTFCFTPETNIFTKDGIKEIKDIKLGEEILTYDGSYSKNDFIFQRSYSGDIIKVKSSNLPDEISCTPNHKLFVVKKGETEPEFIEASKLEKGDSLTFPIIRETVDVKKLDVHNLISETFIEIPTKVKTLQTKTAQNILLLKEDGSSQRSIAKELGINRETVNNYINNKSRSKITIENNNKNIKFKYGKTSIPSKIKVNKPFMRLVGYFLAEGNVSFSSKRPNSGILQFTFHKKETEYINDVKDTIKELFNLEAVLVDNSVNNTIQVTIYSNILAYLFKNLFGDACLNKNIPPTFLKLPLEKQRELLKGLFRGDAHLRQRKRGSEYILNTVSKQLAYKTWMILTRLEVVPSFYISKKETRKKANHDQYVLSICGLDLSKLGFVDYNVNNIKKSHRKVSIKDDKILFQIKEIKKEEYFGDVYNMSVPSNNTYTANLTSVSNCVWDQTLYPKGKFRARSPENVLKEVKYLVDDQGVREVFDDCGTITVGPWLKKFCNLMIESGYNKKVMYSCNMRFGAVDFETYKLMKKAGFRLLKYGLESGCQKTIDKLDKGTKISEVEQSCKDAKRAGLTVHLTMMVGYPWETKEDAMETWKLSKRLMLKGYADVLQSTVMVPYPGTPLYQEGQDKNWFRFDPKDYERFDMTEPVFKTPDMTVQEVQSLCQMNYKIYVDPRYMWQHLKRIKTWEDVRYTFDGVKAVLGHIKDFARPVKQ